MTMFVLLYLACGAGVTLLATRRWPKNMVGDGPTTNRHGIDTTTVPAWPFAFVGWPIALLVVVLQEAHRFLVWYAKDESKASTDAEEDAAPAHPGRRET